MKKNVKCDSCGQEYVATNYQGLWVFSILLVAPFIKFDLMNILSTKIGEPQAFILSVFAGIFLLFIFSAIFLEYKEKNNENI